MGPSSYSTIKYGSIIESALDHIYISKELLNRTENSKLKESGTDHVPIMSTLTLKKEKAKSSKKIN